MDDASQLPAFNAAAFKCPHCGTYAHMDWKGLAARHSLGYVAVQNLMFSTCAKCDKYSLWLFDSDCVKGNPNESGWAMIYPLELASPAPHPDMPNSLFPDYQEARAVLSVSPRASSALLRLCIQKLCKELGQPGKNINDDIAKLVQAGLPSTIKQALDVVRVTGNNAVHPGEMSEADTTKLAASLFGLINLIVDNQISQPKRIQELHDMLPAGAKEAIERRDASSVPIQPDS